MAVLAFEPSGDVSNAGWAVTGAQASMWATLSSVLDTNYLSSPPSKGTAVISFPIDTSSLPSGAVIQSISVMARAATGTGTPQPGQPQSLTCAVVAANQTSVFVQRTIYPTSTPTTYTVATYTKDPQGNAWDVNGLNNVLLQAFSYGAVTDLVRLYELYVNVNYKTVPSVNVTAPSGTLNTAAPVVSWSYTQPDGDFQTSAVYKIFPASSLSSPSFSPDTATPTYTGAVSGATTSVTTPRSIPSNSYAAYVQATAQSGAKSAWASSQFTLIAPSPGQPGVADPTGVAPTGQGILSIVPDVANGAAFLTLQDTSNLLGTHMADVTVDDSGEAWITTNCSVAESTNFPFPGGSPQSWKATATGSGNIVASTGFTPVSPGQPLTAQAQVLAGATARNVRVDITYYDASYNALTTVTGTAVADGVGTWTQVLTYDPSSNASAAKAQAVFTVSGCAASEAHYFAHVGLLYGVQAGYSSGGQGSTNLLNAWYSNSEGTAPAGSSWVASPGTTVGTNGSVGTQGFDGTTCNKLTCVAGPGSIALRAVGTAFSATTSGSTYTLNKPSGVTTGDFMLAFVEADVPFPGGAASGTVNAPTGWTLMDAAGQNTSGNAVWLFTFARTAGGSEPTTWTGTWLGTGTRRAATVVAWSGCADVSQQLAAQAQSQGSGGSAYTTPSVVNTDPTAWRISAFATSGNASAPTVTANTQVPGIPPIQYVSTAAAFYGNDKLSSYTINRPAGVQSGDLMIATVSADAAGGTISAPSGWTVARSVVGSGTTGGVLILKRTAGSSEPASWSGTFSVSPTSYKWSKITSCVAYRNVQAASFQFVADNIAQHASTNDMWTPNVTNTNANAWRVVGFFGLGESPPSQQVMTLGGIGASMSVRFSDALQYGNYGTAGAASVALLVADSAGPVPASVQSIHGGAQSSFWSMAAWEAFLTPLASAPTPPANETSRAAITVGSSPYDSLSVFDSNGPVAAQSWSVSASTSSAYVSVAAFIGILKPATSTVSGLVAASIQSPVDISLADPNAILTAGSQITVGGSFLGSVAGTTLLTASFYRANVLISSATMPGGGFGASSGGWSDCMASFPIPTGTTRIGMTVASPGHALTDIVYFDRMFLALGQNASYATGTSASAHPIWSYPEIQYADDTGDGNGFGAWTSVPGTITNVPSYGANGLLTIPDHSIIPLVHRQYRARTVSYGLAGDKFTSAWSPSSAVATFPGQNWWLKDITNPANNIQLKVKWDTFTVAHQNTAVQFQALGAKFPVAITEGFKSDTFSLKMIPVSQTDFARFMTMVTSGKTYYLQSDMDKAWWIQPLGDVSSDVLLTNSRSSAPLREVDVTFLEVGPVA